MSNLAKLNFSKASPRERLTPLARKRLRLLQKLECQIQAAEAEANDEQFLEEVTHWVRNEETGERKAVVHNRLVKPWWWQNEHGAWIISLRDGNRVMPVTDDNASVEVGDKSALIETLKTLREAVIAGELDGQLEKLIKTRSMPKRKGKSAGDKGNAA